mgnify:CR=1 FL=1
MTRKISLAYLTVPGNGPFWPKSRWHQRRVMIMLVCGQSYGQAGEPQVHLENNPGLFASIQVALEETSLQPLDIELVRVKEGPSS